MCVSVVKRSIKLVIVLCYLWIPYILLDLCEVDRRYNNAVKQETSIQNATDIPVDPSGSCGKTIFCRNLV